ncbi:LVIVD repeat-containing protein [Natrinema gelatinilyticum]|uniref:LVIVD repeat-containing protein n=1 Tax=Natrinema gelatinilyticum TaxID=2961571 RepID=UPI0020C2F787|nr:hypothetical protein [Natrinema gelatinilyticum]
MDRRAFLRASGAAGLAPLSISSTAPRVVTAASGQGTYEPLGSLPITGAAEAVAGDHGETAYVAATTGFVTVDVSDPAEPTLLAEERNVEIGGSPLTQILDVSVDGDRLVVAGPANPGFGVAGVRRYDVSDPADPVSIAGFETDYHIHNCVLEGELLYVVANTQQENRLVIFDVGGDEIAQLGYWSLLEREPGWGDIDMLARYLHDVSVRDETAYLPHWNAGTYLVDVSDPTDPAYVTHVAETTLEEQRAIADWRTAVYGLPGNDHYAAVDDTGDLMAVGREAWATGGSAPARPGGIDLYDVTDPTDPVKRGRIDPPRTIDESYRGGLWTTSHNFELRGERLYSTWYRGGVKIHDVSDPANPERLAWWRDPARTAFWTARVLASGEAFVASSTEAIPNTSLEGALYTFPIEAGTQADPLSLRNPEDWRGDTNGTNETGEGAHNETATRSDGSGDSIPGFTGVAGLASGAVALGWLRRCRGNVQD